MCRAYLSDGSVLGTSRENPTKSPEAMQAVIETLQRAEHHAPRHHRRRRHGLSAAHQRAIGRRDSQRGPCAEDDRQRSAAATARPTFGFQTARHVGVELVRNLMEDAKTTRRWYVVVAMGRKAGHLALGIGKAAGATLTIVAEEFRRLRCRSPHLRHRRRRHHQAPRDGPDVRRRRAGRGLIEKLDPAELAGLSDVERDDHGPHVRFAEVDLARKVKAEVQGRLSERGLSVTITDKNVGYELRCADPIPFDAEYPRPRLRRDPLPGRRRQRRHGQRPGRPARANPVRRSRASRRPARPRSGSWTPTARASGSPAPT